MSSRHLIWLALLMAAACILIAGCATQPPGQNNTSTPTAAPTSTAIATVTGTPGGNVTDLSNRNSPEVANFTTYPSTTRLHTPAVRIGLERVIGNLTSPLFVAAPDDGSGRHFVVDQNGYVQIFYLNGTVVLRPFLDVRDRMVRLDPTYDERGLLSIAFHPNFTENGRVYAYYSAPLRAGAPANWSCTNHLSEFTVSATSPDQVDNATERILLEVDKPYQNHNGGILLFGPDDGNLYLTLGDGGRADDTGMGHIPGTGNAQNLTTLLGKVIRIDPNTNTSARAYGIPADNPFQGNASVPAEIYAYGFRNPAYATFDSGGSHRMFVAMAGQRLFESVLIVYRGGAYPWNIREGTHCFDPSNNFQVPNATCRITSYAGDPLIGPIVELGHDVGDTIVGGVVYRGSAIPALDGAYLFGTWSDESRITGNGTLLVAMPPAGLDTATLPEDAANLTAAQNAMWTTSELAVANNANGRINAFVRGIFGTADHEALVLINQNGGPGLTPQNSGEVWRMVSANTSGLVNTTGATATPTPTVAGGAGGTAVALTVTIRGDTFTPRNLSVPAGARVTLTFDDQDVNPHNFAIYPSLTSSEPVFRSPLVNGPVVATYTFTAPSTPGTYYYRSDPNSGALGTLTVTGAGVTVTGTTTPRGTPTVYMEQDSGQQAFPTSVPAVTTAATPGTTATTATTAIPNTTAATPVPTTMIMTTPPTTATAAPTVTTVPPTTVVTTGATTPGAVAIPLAAQNLAFSASTITAPAGSTVTITFNNQDAGVPHNVAVYTDASASTAIFRGQVVTGPATATYTFTAPSQPGSYFFRCDVHPTTMTGTFVVT